MKRTMIFTYGVACYLVFLATFLYAIGFIGNILVPRSMDSIPAAPTAWALLINAGLLSGFALQHSIMARGWFKRAWTRIIPEAAERSTYVLMTCVMLAAMFAFWQPIGGVIWNVEDTVGRGMIYAMYAAGWMLVLVATFQINHFDLFGLRQVWLELMGRPYTHIPFRRPFLYRFVRHPLYVGWFLVFWSAPTMTVAHLFFAVMTTSYILVAIQFEERDLVKLHGAKYQKYREEVPMLVPFTGKTTQPSIPSGAVEETA